MNSGQPATVTDPSFDIETSLAAAAERETKRLVVHAPCPVVVIPGAERRTVHQE